jgi:SAM-dependent methyltransferase
VLVERCQVCDGPDLEPLVFLGFLPPVNTMPAIGQRPPEQPMYPAQLLRCPTCTLVQLGLVVDPAVLFPPSYPYTSGTTKVLRENFAQLRVEVEQLYPLKPGDLVVDIGSNDGTLLANFRDAGYRVCGIEPTDAGALARARSIETVTAFFGDAAAREVVARHGRAKVITATNVFAHVENVHGVVEALLGMLADDGVFISESHYLLSLVETLQYDTIYHEHLRYYALGSLTHLLRTHDLEVVHARRIPTHGGSIRVYAARKDALPVRESVAVILAEEAAGLTPARFAEFRRRVSRAKLELLALLRDVTRSGARVVGIGAPSRATTLINYVGIDDTILDAVLEIAGSHKVGKYLPGTIIPVLDESRLQQDQPDYALLLSWHLADELIPKLRARGFRGRFIVPLPAPAVRDA